jgi:hypothetical protein
MNSANCLAMLLLLAAMSTMSVAASGINGQIVVGKNAPDKEIYAAKELQRYLYALSGTQLPIRDAGAPMDRTSFILGQPSTNSDIAGLLASEHIAVGPSDPGPEGYVLKKTQVNGQDVLVIAGSDEMGTLYGVYGLLDDHYGVGFYMGGDVLPGTKRPLYLPNADERVAPRQKIRGFLPWTNFPQSATVYSAQDYFFILDQMAKMRMNFLEIHNYNGMCGHNEMFHNFTCRGITSRVFMATAATGHSWGGPGCNVADYKFKSADLFDDYDFGADCALHNKTLSNEEVFRKGTSLFQRVIEYAHARGIRIGLGIEIDLIPPEYNAKPNDPDVVNARIDQIVKDYPNLDCLLCYRSETIKEDSAQVWNEIFDVIYRRMKSEAPQTKIAVSGWGLPAQHVANLPKDVIAAPIADYSAACESGTIYPDREYWGCPWLERDFNSSVHYYPYNMNLSDTVKAYRNRNANMTGFMCLTWRLTDAVDAKMSYIAKAPWDLKDRLSSSHDVYYDYAVKNYGRESAREITDIIDQNEAYACNASECELTPQFTGSDRAPDIAKAKQQLDVIDASIAKTTDPGALARLKLLRNRISAVKAYCELDQSFAKCDWSELPGPFETWSKDFRDRVTDISSLGNLVSSQNRLVKTRYVAREKEFRQGQSVKAPSYVDARGTRTGAEITWRWKSPATAGFNIYRDDKKLNSSPLPSESARFVDRVNGTYQYTVTSVSMSGEESPRSVPSGCKAGSADKDVPNVVVISPPTSIAVGKRLELTARVLDSRTYDCLSAVCYYRTPGADSWRKSRMERRVRSVFTVSIPVTASGLEYYIEATDGTNAGYYPKTAPAVNASVVVYKTSVTSPPSAPNGLATDGKSISWTASKGDVFWYRIYRSGKKDFTPGLANLITYVHKDTLRFEDADPGFDGQPLSGTYYYRVTAVDKLGNESKPSNETAVLHTTSHTTGQIMEAEDAVLHGVELYTDPGASGAAGVGFFGEDAGDSITFNDVGAAKAIRITYANAVEKDTRCGLYVDGVRVRTITFPVSGGWFLYKTLDVEVEVKNEVRLQVDADDLAANKGFCANIDCIELIR